jgi:hypothetical protein
MPSAFVDGRWWIVVVVVGGGGRSSTVVLDLHGRMLALVDGTDGDSSRFSQVDRCCATVSASDRWCSWALVVLRRGSCWASFVEGGHS